ncbi:DUF6188 family protein [Streptomyces sp. NPDC102274]|uniref:DUF6188 family protein n=1 Tax=Streptomyces sp. NPDC102274 TaxID=3366151 RepID=UPI003816D174
MNLRGVRVSRVSIEFRLTLTLDSGWEVALETPARLSSGSIRTDSGVVLTPEVQDVAAVLPLFGVAVLSAVAFKSGTLRMVFEEGTHLTCPTDASFEAWQITGPGGRRIVSLPGGDLGVWSGSGPGERAPCCGLRSVPPQQDEQTPLSALWQTGSRSRCAARVIVRTEVPVGSWA